MMMKGSIPKEIESGKDTHKHTHNSQKKKKRKKNGNDKGRVILIDKVAIDSLESN